jgi:hypothetical protein
VREGTYRVHVPEEYARDPDLPERFGPVNGGAFVVLNGKNDLPPSVHDLLGMTLGAQWAGDGELDAVIHWTRGGRWVADMLDAGEAKLLALHWNGRYVVLDCTDGVA